MEYLYLFVFTGSIIMSGVLFFLYYFIRQYIQNKKLIRQTQEQLLNIQQEKVSLEHKEKELNLYFISIIHDMKIPISIIQNTLQLFEENQKMKKDTHLMEIKNNISFLNRDISNILDVEKIKQSQLLYKHTSILNISKVIKKIVNNFKQSTYNKKIALTLSSEGALYIKFDPHALNRIIYNLIDNAIKYTAQGGEIHLSLTSDTSCIYLKIEDSGTGIPEKELQRIFSPYYKVKHKNLPSYGLGIGLYLVKSILTAAGGKISVQSELQKGTTFTLVFTKYIPVKGDSITPFHPEKKIQHRKLIFPREEFYEDKYTILIVEDNEQLLLFLMQTLLPEYNVYYARNGEEALYKLPFIPKPDIIISDIVMEKMGGYEFFTKMMKKEDYNDIPFLFLTASTITGDEKINYLKQGVIDYIFKPFNIVEVKAKIAAILQHRDKIRRKEIENIETQIATIISKKGDKRFVDFEKKCKTYKLTGREKEVMHLLLDGLLMKEIAEKLFLSIHTVRNHIRKIYKKCHAQNRAELLNLFRE